MFTVSEFRGQAGRIPVKAEIRKSCLPMQFTGGKMRHNILRKGHISTYHVAVGKYRLLRYRMA